MSEHVTSESTRLAEPQRGQRTRESGAQQHGNIFSRASGSMLIHVQRENGLAHRTLVLRPWQVQVLRVLTSKTFRAVLMVGVLSWGYFAVQSARVPFLTQRIAHLEQDAQRLDTLQRTLVELQDRYGQVQRLLTASKVPATAAPMAAPMAAKVAAKATATRDAQKLPKKNPQED